jgi:hypothetical protein
MTVVARVTLRNGNTIHVHLEQSELSSTPTHDGQQRIEVDFRDCIDSIERLVVHGSNGSFELPLEKKTTGS